MLQEPLLNYVDYEEPVIEPIEFLKNADCEEKLKFSNTSVIVYPLSPSAAIGPPKLGVQCVSSSFSGSCVSGSSIVMEEPSCCRLSLAVDCTLSLGSTASRQDIPARLSRAGSPAQDLTWTFSVRSEQVDASRRTCDLQDTNDLGKSWSGSSNRNDADVTPDFYPQVVVSGRETRGTETPRRGAPKAWPRPSVHSFKDELDPSKGLFKLLENQTCGSRSSRQPWLPAFLSSGGAAVDSKATSRAERCMQEGNNFVRVCAHCGTSKTPLWRNGPQGPKSLCNACGIRFKKAGRRSAANGLSESPSPPPTTAKMGKRKVGDDLDQQYWAYPPESKPRKRSRGSFLRSSDSILSGGSCMTWQSCLLPSTPKTQSQQDFRPSSVAHVQDKRLLQMGAFATDEEEGAVLLMALSCGMVNA